MYDDSETCAQTIWRNTLELSTQLATVTQREEGIKVLSFVFVRCEALVISFVGLVLGCTEADFCKELLILKHFSNLHDLHHSASAQTPNLRRLSQFV